MNAAAVKLNGDAKSPSYLGSTYDVADAPKGPLDAIDELKRRRIWVAWKIVMRADAHGNMKPTKPPVNPHTGFGASHSDPSHWGTYEQAAALAERRSLPGVGIVLQDDDDLVGIDLDKCRNAETGQLEEWVQEIVDFGETYAEVSPSGTGVRLIARGKVPATVKCDPAHVEIYRSQRYLTVTEEHLIGSPDEINPAPRTLAALMERVERLKPRPSDPPPPAHLPAHHAPAPAAPSAPLACGSDFFRNVNDKALASLASWVPVAFPSARFQAGTGAYRVSSRALGRSLQEDLSLSPEGIKDFGVADMGDPRLGARTPIDVLIEWCGHASPLDAGKWLCDRMGVTPEALGWGEHNTQLIALGTATARALDSDAAIPPRATLMIDGVTVDAETGEIVEAHAAADAPTQAQRPPVVNIRTVNAASFADQPVPRQRWLIEGLIPSANVGIIAGDGAVGKSLLALQLCVAVALGGEWIGFRPAGGRALYVSCEDEAPELHRRLHRLCPDLAALANLDLIDLAGKDAVMAAPDRAGLLKPTGLYAAIRHVIATRRPSLIVLDNLSDTFGGDEVKRVHARQFIALMRALALEFDTTVLILQHPSQSGLASGSGTSGSTGWSNGVRTRLFLERRLVREGNAQVEADRDIRVMSMKKANRSPLGDQIVIKWVNGRFEREELRSFNLRDAAQHAERTFVKLLRLHAAQGRNLSAHKCSTYAPAVFERHPGADGVTGSAFALAMERLLEAGTIAVEEVGSPSKRRQRLVVIAEGDPETFATSDEDGAPSGDAR